MPRLPRDRAPHRAAAKITPPQLTPDRLFVQGVGLVLDEQSTHQHCMEENRAGGKIVVLTESTRRQYNVTQFGTKFIGILDELEKLQSEIEIEIWRIRISGAQPVTETYALLRFGRRLMRRYASPIIRA